MSNHTQKNMKKEGHRNVSHNCLQLLKNNRDDNFRDRSGFNGDLREKLILIKTI